MIETALTRVHDDVRQISPETAQMICANCSTRIYLAQPGGPGASKSEPTACGVHTSESVTQWCENAEAICAYCKASISLAQTGGPGASKSELTVHSVHTLESVTQWCQRQAEWCRSLLVGDVTALVWPYRAGQSQYLSVDLKAGTGSAMITFTTGVPHDFSVGDNVRVPDMVEALHMADLLLHHLAGKVEAIGRASCGAAQ